MPSNFPKKDMKDMGLRLLKKSRRGLTRMVFSRAGFITLFLLLQLTLLTLFFVRLRNYLPHYYTIVTLFSGAMALYLLNGKHDPTAKLTWIVFISLLPAFGGPLYFLTQSDIGHRLLKKRFSALTEETRDSIPVDPETAEHFLQDAPQAVGLCRYVNRTGCYPVFDHCNVRYFPLGDDMFPEMLHQLEKAEHFIFLEFFVVDEGLMWGEILEILARKAAEGVDVRLIYDGTCEFTTLPHDYPARLKELGIQCKAFAPITPFVSTYYNYRDHRKILVIDGHTAFNGGVNLADEYINIEQRFGHWKDTAVMVQGPAVQSFTLMFLQMWNIDTTEPVFGDFLAAEAPRHDAKGYVMPYSDCPLDDERVGEWVYLDLLNRAKRYVYIMTPYLILDGEMETAIKFAAERGVDVRIILPGIPDKAIPYALAKTHYASLLRSGVKLYEYTPGFVHAKVFVCDDQEAVVGTINLDYRSLYHHFECATYMNGTDCIPQIREDFLETQKFCRQASLQTLRREPLRRRIGGFLVKVIAPLL